MLKKTLIYFESKKISLSLHHKIEKMNTISLHILLLSSIILLAQSGRRKVGM
jgi:hypothetical protein